MDKALHAEYLASTYLVCVDAAQWSPIHIDASLPDVLQTLVGHSPWGFITAWNPHSTRRSDAANTAAQRQLVASIRASAELLTLYPGVGIGTQGWYEPSLFVLGLDRDALDQLCSAHEQNAYVLGRGSDLASLRWLRA